ncbi:Protein of unknown function [Pyronema omphalodes CBS 100304]|uniref:Uncharacterized protein n=1 Tax=Pyronema omphalodes (strain CBS 100304) TaxID=1076935 RepID=U4LLG4_PYROM|nr:Protein of unknown function [Pyronema omphalodes CBS 100304]
MAYSRVFLFALLLVAMFMMVSATTEVYATARPSSTGYHMVGRNNTNATSPTGPKSPSDQDSAGTTISSSAALFGALVAAALFSL